MKYLFGLALDRNGAFGCNLAFGYCDRYVIMDSSSTLGLTISSGLTSCRRQPREQINIRYWPNSVSERDAHLRNAQPVVGQRHGFGSVLQGVLGVPIAPVGTQTYYGIGN